MNSKYILLNKILKYLMFESISINVETINVLKNCETFNTDTFNQ